MPPLVLAALFLPPSSVGKANRISQAIGVTLPTTR